MGLDAVELVLWAEKCFGVDIPDADAETLVTVGALADFLHQLLANQRIVAQLSRVEIFDNIKQYLVVELGINPELITPDAKFVKDLGLQ